MADLFMVGQFNGVDHITAVSIGSQVMHMLTVMIVGLAMGSTVTIGKAIGAKEHKQALAAVYNTVTLFMGVSVVCTAMLLFLVEPITAIMSTPSESVSSTKAYLTICFTGIPFITAYNIISAVFRMCEYRSGWAAAPTGLTAACFPARSTVPRLTPGGTTAPRFFRHNLSLRSSVGGLGVFPQKGF